MISLIKKLWNKVLKIIGIAKTAADGIETEINE